MVFLEIITPFLFAAFGGLYSELAGYTNVSLEGYIALGGFLFILFVKITNSLILGIVLTSICLVIVALIQSLFTIAIKAKEIITGLAINMLISGLISLVSFSFFKTKGVIQLQEFSGINSQVLTIIAFLIPVISYLVIYKTVFGLRLRSLGLNERMLLYSKANPNYYKVIATVFSALLAGFGGVYLAMRLRSYTPNLGGGRGWIALVIVFLGRKNPVGIFFSSCIFALSLMISNFSQGSMIPSDIVLAIPYIITLLALILSSFGKEIKYFIRGNKDSREKK